MQLYETDNATASIAGNAALLARRNTHSVATVAPPQTGAGWMGLRRKLGQRKEKGEPRHGRADAGGCSGRSENRTTVPKSDGREKTW